jgi:mono/diheme cytochrome c family protein
MIRALLVSVLSSGLVVGCGSDPAPSAEAKNAPIVPGDPRFVRDPSLDVENVSAAGERRSHPPGDPRWGANCMSCHQAKGPGRGLFTAAGTVKNADGTPDPGGVVELRTAPAGGGDPVATLAVDDHGNFFTTASLPFPDTALFPWLKSKDGARAKGMPFPTVSGACNACHAGGKPVRNIP